MTFFQRHPRLAGALVSLVTTGLLLAVIEAVFPWLVPFVPLTLQRYLPSPVHVLAQSSKSGLIPRDYTALLGDSYAQGEGDWHLSIAGLSNPPYHSAHLLRDGGLGDVVSFGGSGAGSLEGIVLLPLGSEAVLNTRGRFPAIGPPRRALVYFYEGNDLDNNQRTLQETFLPRYGADAMFDERRFQGYIESRLEQDSLMWQARSMNWRTRIIAARFITTLLVRAFSREPASPPPFEAGPRGSARTINHARLGGVERDLPDRLQGPALELTDEELRASIWVFQQALVFAMRRWAATSFSVVFIPSPLACYDLEGEEVSPQLFKRPGPRFPRSMVKRNSDWIAEEVRRIAHEAGAGFIDARPDLQAAARERPIHGPRDWRHLNRIGYGVLARTILSNLSTPKNPRES